MTHGEVDKVESLLREAEAKVEEAGRMCCKERNAGATVWYRITQLAHEVANVIHLCHHLRPLPVADEPVEVTEESNGDTPAPTA